MAEEEVVDKSTSTKDEDGNGVPNLSDANDRQHEEVRAAAEGREPDFSQEHLDSYEQPMTTLNPQGGVENEVTEEMLDRSVGAPVSAEASNVEHQPEPAVAAPTTTTTSSTAKSK